MNYIQFERMKHLRYVWKVLGTGVHNGGELAFMFEQQKARFSDPVNSRTGTEDALANGNVPRPNPSSDAPVEAVPRAFVAIKLHQLKQLMVADEARVAHLTQQPDVPFRIDDQAAFCVPHKRT